MADCSAYWIKIGGDLKEEDVGELGEIISNAGLGIEWGECLGDNAEDVVRTWQDGALALFDSERPWGHCEDLEAFCQEKGLPYVYGDDGHYTWGAGVSCWKPGMDQEHEWVGTSDGVPCLSWAAINHFRSVDGLDAELALMEEVSRFAIPFRAPGWPAEEPPPSLHQVTG